MDDLLDDALLGTQGLEELVEVLLLRRRGQHHLGAPLSHLGQQVGRPGKGVEMLGLVRLVVLGVQVAQAFPLLTEQVFEQLVGPHPDQGVDAGHGDVLARLLQRLPPRDGVEVVGVEQGAVDVEQDGGAG